MVTHDGRIAALAQREFPQLYPRPGWVEHDPQALWTSQIAVARQVLREQDLVPSALAAIGIANQRETTIVWERETGNPIYNAIVWQDRRTAPLCDQLRNDGWEEQIRAKTGLVIDSYFSGTKLKWILDNVEDARQQANRGRLLFGTVDTFLIWRLTSGRLHMTDYSNAARTMLFNIHTLQWDDDLLHALNIPRSMLPDVRPSADLYGETDARVFGESIPIAGDAGDQHAATFAQACFSPGAVKNTYGTGNFMLMNTGSKPRPSRSGLLTTIAWGMSGNITYALEGSVFVTGAAVQWLRDELRIITDAKDTEQIARSIPDTAGVYLIPAFVGLGAPYWDPYARGTIIGLTRGTGRAHIVRATLEAVAYQSRDVLDAMRRDAELEIPVLRVDGGMAGNDFLMQFQADMSAVQVERPTITETTALGAAYLAGLAVGFWTSQDEIGRLWTLDRMFRPSMGEAERDGRYRDWQRAVERSRAWSRPRE